MKYPAKLYGRAFAEAAAGKSEKERHELVRNFAELIARNGDTAHASKIIAEAEKALLAKDGRRKAVIESVRPLTAGQRKSVLAALLPTDVHEEVLNPALVAGIRITVDGERQFDGSFSRKLQKMFA